MKKFFLLVIIVVSALICHAQTIDERIAGAMNRSDWFALDSIYNETPKDSINPFLEVFSRGLIGNRLNRPDLSIPAFEELLETYSSCLDLSNLLNSAVMLSLDYSKVGENAKASTLLTSVLNATRQYLDSTAIAATQLYIDRYTALTAFNPYTISIDGSQGIIPFHIQPVGNPDKGAVLMNLDECSVNDIDADITFDTGAGVNIISDSLSKELGLIPLDAYHQVRGIGTQQVRYAIAKEIRLGNITIKDVPFVIVNLEVDNEEANKYMDCLSIAIGSELMIHLQDLTLDFITREITVPTEAPARSTTSPNMCFSPSMNIITKGTVHNESLWMCLDTGDSSFGSLNGDFFRRNKEYVLDNSRPDTLRMAGIGGVHISECYNLSNVGIDLGGGAIVVPEITVNPGLNPLGADYECNLGLKSLMRFDKIHFNMTDLTIATYPARMSLSLMPKLSAASFRYSNNKPSFLQTIGLVTVSIANGLFNHNAPSAPDL